MENIASDTVPSEWLHFLRLRNFIEVERCQKHREKAESGICLFTKGTQAPVSRQVACLALGLPPRAEDSAFFDACFPPSCVFEIRFFMAFFLFICFVLGLF